MLTNILGSGISVLYTHWSKGIQYIMHICIIYNETRRSKMPFIIFLIAVAKNMITIGKSQMGEKSKLMKRGRPSNRTKFIENVGDHLPLSGTSRNSRKKKRTKISCQMCVVAFCKDCFAKYHS